MTITFNFKLVLKWTIELYRTFLNFQLVQLVNVTVIYADQICITFSAAHISFRLNFSSSPLPGSNTGAVIRLRS